MARLKTEDVASLDVKELEEQEYSTETYDSYAGEVPPVGTELFAYVKRMWWTRTATKADGSGNDPMLKILTVAGDNDGELAEFNGCTFWLNAPLIAGAKFRWDPFLNNFGISLRAIKARKVEVEDKPDQNGAPIVSIDGFRPGEESDEAWCRIVTDQEPYNGIMQARVGTWLPYDVEDEEPSDNGDEYEDDDEDSYEEDEPDEPEPEPPARTRRTASKATGARSGPRAAPTARKPAAAGSAPRTARSTGTRGKAAAAAPAGRRGRRSKGDEPPF